MHVVPLEQAVGWRWEAVRQRLSDLSYRILEALLHRNEKDRLADTVPRSVAMLLAGASLRSTSPRESDAYFRGAMEIASRLIDGHPHQLGVYTAARDDRWNG